MKIEKRGKDSYRARKTYQGKTYTHTFDHKPTQKEAMKALADKMERSTDNGAMTFEKGANEYIKVKEAVLSASTVRGYLACLKQLSPTFKKIRLDNITQVDIQSEINRLCDGRAPKTVKNYNGFICSVVSMFRPDLSLYIKLPQAEKKEPYIPTDEECKKILDFAKGSEYYIPFMLGAYGLRRSEICALTIFDLHGNKLDINKALVQDKDGNWVLKQTKTTASTRTVYIPDELAKEIRKKGYIYRGFPGSINDRLAEVQRKLGIEHFPLHKLRHYFASTMHELGCSDAEIMAAGGWSTDSVMKNVYRHAKDNEEKRISNADMLARVMGQ